MAENRGVLLAVDLGSARIGVAACDESRILAYPLETIPASQEMTQRIDELVRQTGAGALIVGYPLALDGHAGIAADKVHDLAHQLADKVEVPIWLVDERMTTAEAHAKLRATGKNHRKAKKIVDAQAAVGILNSVLRALEQGRTIHHELELKETHDTA